MDGFRQGMYRYYKQERDRAEACIADIIDILNGDGGIDEIEARILRHYMRANGQTREG